MFEAAKGTVEIIDRASKPLQAISKNFEKLSNTANKINLSSAGSSIEKINNRLGRFQGYIQKRTSNLMSETAGVLALGYTLKQAVAPAVEFESALIGVSKYADFSGNKALEFKKSILNLSDEIGVQSSKLAQIAESGLAGGVAQSQILAFTEMVAKSSIAFGMSAEETGQAFSDLRNIFNMDVSGIKNTADALNYMTDTVEGNSASVKDTIEIITRSGGIGNILKLTASEVGAVGSAFLSMGQKTEVAATATNALLTNLGDPMGQNKDFQAGLAKIGMTATELKKAVDKDAKSAIINFLNAINKLPQEDRLSALSLMFGRQYADNIAAVAGNTRVLEESLNAVANSAKYAGSAEKEFKKVSASTERKMENLETAIKNVAIKLGDTLLPDFKKLLDFFNKIIPPIGDFISKNDGLVESIALVAGGLLALKVSALASTALLWALSPAITAATFAAKLFNASLWANPITWIVAGVVALTAGIYLLVKNWDLVKTKTLAVWDVFKNTTAGQVLISYFNIISNVAKIVYGAISLLIEKISRLWKAFMQSSPILALKANFELLAGVAKSVGDTILNAFSSVFNWISDKISFFSDQILGVLKKIEGITSAGASLFSSSSPAPAPAVVKSNINNRNINTSNVIVNVTGNKSSVETSGNFKHNVNINRGRQQ